MKNRNFPGKNGDGVPVSTQIQNESCDKIVKENSSFNKIVLPQAGQPQRLISYIAGGETVRAREAASAAES